MNTHKHPHPWRTAPTLPRQYIFCQYVIGSSGAKCGMYISFGEFCKRHAKKPQKKFVTKGKRFGGDSSWREENGYFKNK